MPMNNKKKLLTVKKTCEIYGLEPSLIYHWVRYKKFNFYKIDKKILIKESDFKDFLESYRVDPPFNES